MVAMDCLVLPAERAGTWQLETPKTQNYCESSGKHLKEYLAVTAETQKYHNRRPTNMAASELDKDILFMALVQNNKKAMQKALLE